MEPGASEHILAAELIGQSQAMRDLREQIVRLADCEVNLLLQGESGTGKELAARAVHRLSGRCDGPFIGVNCAAIHESLLESELFGHVAGAFTGATTATLGFLRAAAGGTILLDEVGDMSEPLQSKLLRVLEERAVVPVGGTDGIAIDVRVVAATHRDLGQAVSVGEFRADLYYRINVVCLSIPPLRERSEDVPALAEHLSKQTAGLLGMPVKELSAEALDALGRYDWPGNIRQLGNAIQQAYVFGQGPVIRVRDLPAEVLGEARKSDPGFPTLQQAIREHVEQALARSGGVRSHAADMLDIDRKSLWRMMHRFHIS